jgi:hypothetical protein
VHVLHSLFNSLFAADTNDGADTLLDTPRRSNASHAHVVLLCDLLNSPDDLLVGLKFTRVYEGFDEVVGLRALGGSVVERTCECATRNGRPRNEADSSILTVGYLNRFDMSEQTA